MGIYTGLSEEQLEAKLVELRGKIEEFEAGGRVVRVAGEGRMMEFSQARGSSGLWRLYNQAQYELNKLRGIESGGAIGVIFP